MDDNIYNALFGARVRYYRERRNLTQKELSEMVGYTVPATISRIENGNQTIPLSKLPAFCEALQVDPYDLLGLREKDQQITSIAETLGKKNKTADIQQFVDLYLKLLEGSEDGDGYMD